MAPAGTVMTNMSNTLTEAGRGELNRGAALLPGPVGVSGMTTDNFPGGRATMTSMGTDPNTVMADVTALRAVVQGGGKSKDRNQLGRSRGKQRSRKGTRAGDGQGGPAQKARRWSSMWVPSGIHKT